MLNKEEVVDTGVFDLGVHSRMVGSSGEGRSVYSEMIKQEHLEEGAFVLDVDNNPELRRITIILGTAISLIEADPKISAEYKY